MSNTPLRIVIAGGGTGGHVFPALAVAETLCARLPGSQVLFVGSEGGLEERLIPEHGHRLELLRVGKLRGEGIARAVRTLGELPLAGIKALSILIRFAPDAVVGVGGYASGPVVLAAALLRIPTLLLEQNSIPGTTNRILARVADQVVVAFRRAARSLPEDRTLLLGNPLRPSLLAALARAGERRLDPARPCLLVLGGSQGAHALNELCLAAAPRITARLPGLRLIHQTGSRDLELVRQRYREAAIDARVEPFITEMAEVYLDADLVLGRAGATTIAELTAAGIPALLVPYPHAADDHQAENAREIVEAGGALAERQETLDPSRLAGLLGELLGDGDRLLRMGRAMRGCAFPEAASAIVDLLRTLASGRRHGLFASARRERP
jgi:UDP-N-acetylglucosamine--N-acetylmuramyl-(pentapeptide) pyrophosphoryl-undecaprenol N-acetylglucosamine transferase